MPTYEYQCSRCGHDMEAFHSMTAAPLVNCPACGEDSLRRLISKGAGMIFKGSGFYQTDYKNSGKPVTDKPAVDKSATGAPAGESKPAPEKKAPSCGGGCAHG